MTRTDVPLTTTVDGNELFMKFAGQVSRGEVLITHIVAYLEPQTRQYVMDVTGKTWEGSTLKMKITAETNDRGLDRPSPMVTVPVQVRELIFDEPQRPIYDADLVDEE